MTDDIWVVIEQHFDPFLNQSLHGCLWADVFSMSAPFRIYPVYEHTPFFNTLLEKCKLAKITIPSYLDYDAMVMILIKFKGILELRVYDRYTKLRVTDIKNHVDTKISTLRQRQ